MSLKLATSDQLSRSWWPWYTMEFIQDDEGDERGKRGDRIYVQTELVNWPILIKVKALIVQDLLRARRRGWRKSAAYHTQRLQVLERIEREFGTMMRQESTMTLKEASAAWMADHLSRDVPTIKVHRACHGKETHDMCLDCRRLVLNAWQHHQVIKTEVLD